MTIKKKVPIILVGIILCLFCQTFLNGQDSQDDRKEPKKISATTKPQLPGYLADSAESTPDMQAPEDNLMTKFMLAVFLVIVLGAIAYFCLKKMSGRLSVTAGKNISVIETLNLGPQKALHVIQVTGGTKLLIGTTNSNINMLADISDSIKGDSDADE